MALLACQLDATVREGLATVLACEPAAQGYDVVLDAVLLYPEGGGQPSDHGTIAGLPVRALSKRPDGAVVHRLDAPVHGQVRVQVDWARRFDHMVQHTGQHLLTAVAQRDLGFATTAFHLGPERCDIELDAPALDEAQIAALEEACNAIIREARPVTPRVVTRQELDGLGVRTRGLPEGLTGPIRLIEIADLDLNTCGGTHVSSTAQLQAIKLLDTERLRGGVRLHFLVGARVLAALAVASAREAALTRALSQGPEGHLSAVEKLAEDARKTSKALKAMSAELALTLGEALAGRAETELAVHREDADMGFLNAVAGALLARRPDAVLLLTAGATEGVFLLAGPEDRVKAAGAGVAALLEGRGGGARGRFQGKAARLDRRDEALALLREQGPPSG